MPASVALFKKYLHHTLVETGAYKGDGIQCALDSGFEKVISIELSERHFIACKCRFEEDSRVRMVWADSGVILPEVLMHVHERVTFWLDGHWSGGDTGGDAQHETPLLAELDAIAAHPVKGHTILIDDLQCWRRERVGFGAQEIMAKIRAMSPDYRFAVENGPSGPSGILAARFV